MKKRIFRWGEHSWYQVLVASDSGTYSAAEEESNFFLLSICTYRRIDHTHLHGSGCCTTECWSPWGWGLGVRLANVLKIHGPVGATRSREPSWRSAWWRALETQHHAVTQHPIVLVLRESFGGLVQIYPLVGFHKFQLVLPSVAHPQLFFLIKHAAI